MSIRDSVYKASDGSALFANLLNTKEATDSYHEVNHEGFGRIRNFKHFLFHIETDVMERRKFLRLNEVGKWSNQFQSQVFQIGVCPLRCRYCFVDKENLDGTNPQSAFLKPVDVIQMFLESWPNIRNLDISGGSPDLCPEFLFKLLSEIERVDLKGRITIWVESNLDVNYYSKMSKNVIEYIATFPNFHLLCSLKGWDSTSVTYNTRNMMSFDQQLEGLRFFCQHHFPLSVYLVFIGHKIADSKEVASLYSQLKHISFELPERCIPLYIKKFHAQGNLGDKFINTYDDQKRAASWWDEKILNARKETKQKI